MFCTLLAEKLVSVSLDSLTELSSVTLSSVVQHVVGTYLESLVCSFTLHRRMHVLSV